MSQKKQTSWVANIPFIGARLAKFNITAKDVTDGRVVYHILAHIDDNRIYYTNNAAHQSFMRAFK